MIERRANAPNKPDKVPAWMVTFADLMALMMTFFVLLFSFSKMDENKYKAIVNSMTIGFDGVQWIKNKMGSKGLAGPEPGVFSVPVPTTAKPAPAPEQAQDSALRQEKNSLYTQLSKQLQEEIVQGKVHLLRQPDGVLIRLPEKLSFESASDELLSQAAPMLRHIGTIISKTNARITISGHTDDLPINTKRFRSNWDLSSARAVSVAHSLIMGGNIYRNRITIEGHADTQPIKPNTTPANRTANRRVEISIRFDSPAQSTP